MGTTHSSTNASAAADGGCKEVHALLHLCKRHVVSGDTPFHRAVRGSSSSAAARRRLETLCEAVLQHSELLLRQLDKENGGESASSSRSSQWLCAGGTPLAEEEEDGPTTEPWPTTGAALLRRFLDVPNHKGQTALHLACEVGYAEAVELLLAQGANPWMKDRMGAHTPLHVACLRARLPCVKLLLDELPVQWRRCPSDASVSYVEALTLSGFTPLHCAVASLDVACIRAVLSHHPRLDASNRYDSWEFQLEFPKGTTPMHVAASRGSQAATKELLRYHNNRVLASQGRLQPLPSPSVFGGAMPTLGSPTPVDPRLAVNSTQQLPWQVAYAMHIRHLAEMLHPSVPLSFFFPAPPVMTLQTLASAVLRQRLLHALEAAQQADELQQRRRSTSSSSSSASSSQRRRTSASSFSRPQQPQQQQQQQHQGMACSLPNPTTVMPGSSVDHHGNVASMLAMAAQPPKPTGVSTAAGMARSGANNAVAMAMVLQPSMSEVIASTASRIKQAMRSRSSQSEEQVEAEVEDETCSAGIAESCEEGKGHHGCCVVEEPVSNVSTQLLQLPGQVYAPPPAARNNDGVIAAAAAAAATQKPLPPSPFATPTASQRLPQHNKAASGCCDDAWSPHCECMEPERTSTVNGSHQGGDDDQHVEEEEEEEVDWGHNDKQEGDLCRASRVCAVCLDAEARMRMAPCRHCLCAACSHELVRNMTSKPLACPLCRTLVRGFGVAEASR